MADGRLRDQSALSATSGGVAEASFAYYCNEPRLADCL